MYAPPSPFSTSPPTRRVNGVLHAPFTLFADASPPSSLAVVAPGATALFDISARHSTPLPLRPSTPAASDAAASFLDARHARRPLCSTSALLDATVLDVAACLFARCVPYCTAFRRCRATPHVSTFRHRRATPRSRLAVVLHLRPTTAEGGSGGKGATRACHPRSRRRSSRFAGAVATLDAAVFVLDARRVRRRRSFPRHPLSSTSPSVNVMPAVLDAGWLSSMSPSPVNGILPPAASSRLTPVAAVSDAAPLRLRATALFDDAAPLSRATVLFDASTLVRVCRRALPCRDAFRRCCAFRRLTLRHSAAPPACHRPFDAAARFETAAHFNGTGPLTRATALFDDAAPLACRRPFRRRRASLACHRPFRRRRAPPHVPLRASTPPHHFAYALCVSTPPGISTTPHHPGSVRADARMPAVLDVTPHRASAMLFAFDGSTRDSTLRRCRFFFSTPAALDAAVAFLGVTVLDVAGCLFGTRYCSRLRHSTHTRHHRFRHSATLPACATRPFDAGIHGPTT
ncbi:hypothetical protein MSAN_02477700 [Mycena sanguinolenta]|uniref:Uncharacterized protein n=1 Tax=Mycena sanguinolenta TaxID=230812 RepID=A0A8H6U3R5_9AGAR|nr:hypothetical protein MSAN_02477700 [Mycena sanguinolenta]